MATVARELETAEIAYSCIDQADKVEYLRYIKVGPSDIKGSQCGWEERDAAIVAPTDA